MITVYKISGYLANIGCLGTGEETIEKIFKVSGRKPTHP